VPSFVQKPHRILGIKWIIMLTRSDLILQCF
jgi:hypothetical protein